MKEQLYKYIYRPESENIINKYIQSGYLVLSINTPDNSSYMMVLFEREKQADNESDTQIIRGQEMHDGRNYGKQ